jgi:multidrug efflux pump subunit AcrA (membrane-fusion protein)
MSGSAGKSLAELKNDVFDGRISQQEFDSRVGAPMAQADLDVAAAQAQVAQAEAEQVRLAALTAQADSSQAVAEQAQAAAQNAKANLAAAEERLRQLHEGAQRDRRHLRLPGKRRIWLCGGADGGGAAIA